MLKKKINIKVLTPLSTTVSPEMAAEDKKWWTDERYAIYDLNVNSVAAYPEHEETLDLTTCGKTYTAKGYAYAGGGRRITRVEISLDKGKCMAPYLVQRLMNSC
jgi:nitrate reductase (NAD(P)H)